MWSQISATRSCRMKKSMPWNCTASAPWRSRWRRSTLSTRSGDCATQWRWTIETMAQKLQPNGQP